MIFAIKIASIDYDCCRLSVIDLTIKSSLR
jgi:hypothetical protein